MKTHMVYMTSEHKTVEMVPAEVAQGLYDALKDALDNYGWQGFDGDDYDRYAAALAAADGEEV